MQFDIKTYIRYFILLVLSLTLHVSASSGENINVVRLSDHIPTNAISNSALIGRLEASAPVSVTFILPLRNQEVLEDLLTRLYDPTDKLYGKYLTPEEFNERFSPTEEDYNKVIAYAESQGLEITGTHSNRTLLKASAQTHVMEKTFSLTLDQYQTPSGRQFHAPNNNPQVPTSIASVISGIVGLDNHAVWRSFHIQREITEEQRLALNTHAFPSGPNGGFSPSDIIAAYNLASVRSKGLGQKVALFQLGKYNSSDIDAYSKQFGLPPAKLTNISVSGGASGGADGEVTLDIELVHALAPESEIYVYEGPNTNQGVLDTYNRIATDNIAKTVSTSWGLGEDLNGQTQQLQAENAIFQQMAAHGQTIFAASGDDGAFDDYNVNGSKSHVVDDPASQPYVVGVGGTKLSVNQQNGSYVSEVVWNEGLGSASGGGVSSVWPIPAWQSNVNTTYSKTNRNVPDVSLNADPGTGYAIYFKGQWTVFGGTSCAAPLWAGFAACVNQGLALNNKPSLGFVNPTLYAIGVSAAYATNFLDIATGDNLFYHAGPGYDNATGWGSFNGANLYATLTNTTPVQPPIPPPTKAAPALNITLKHSLNHFKKGGEGVFKVDIVNKGNAPTSGPVTVQVALPKGITIRHVNSSGWSFNQSTQTFSQNHSIKAGSSYPSITMVLYVGKVAHSTVTVTAAVSGGGSASSTASSQISIR